MWFCFAYDAAFCNFTGIECKGEALYDRLWGGYSSAVTKVTVEILTT